MIRETFIATTDIHVVHLPKDWVGKEVTLVYDTSIENNRPETNDKPSLEFLKSIYKNKLVNTSAFKFDREDANNYDE